MRGLGGGACHGCLHRCRCTLSPSFTHDLPCSCGDTALIWAIDNNKVGVVAYLGSIGAPEWRPPRAAAAAIKAALVRVAAAVRGDSFKKI
jgi:hypothetical protein